MDIKLDMFSPAVLNWVMSKVDHTDVITKHHGGRGHWAMEFR
jgi:hypothetical protein